MRVYQIEINRTLTILRLVVLYESLSNRNYQNTYHFIIGVFYEILSNRN